MLKWFSVASQVLSQEPEEWLSYKYGQLIDIVPELRKKKPRLVGVALKILGYIRFLIKNCRLNFLGKNKPIPKVDYLFFYSTENQRKSLEQTMDSLRRHDREIISLCLPEVYKERVFSNDYTRKLWFDGLDVLRSSFIFMLKVLPLIKRLKLKDEILVSWYLDKFIQAYIYICCFYRIYRCCKPSVVVLANDHNVSNRCAMAVAQAMGVKVAYLQHASVSTFFPALDVDYAFLDGEAALEVYRKCSENISPSKKYDSHRTKVFLSGQKKLLNNHKGSSANLVGVASNPLDDIDSVISLIKYLVKNDKGVYVRWHPGQGRAEISALIKLERLDAKIILSDPSEESVGDYFAKLKSLIAGDSSIHLEAALKGLQCIYYEFGTSSFPDYYNYVKNGVAEVALSENEVLSKLESRSLPASSSLRYYSATFGTAWEGHEGSLVSETLIRLSTGENWLNIFGAREV